MTHIENYMDDGANWQAQCVLAILRPKYEYILSESYNKETKRYDSILYVGRYENCREQGYVFTLATMGTMRHYAVYEHRNSDGLCIVAWDGLSLNTPRADQLPMANKNDVTKRFECGAVMECAEWIEKDMIAHLPAQLEAMKELRKEFT